MYKKDETYLLKFAVSGSVDDGKSTLIGRLLYDTQSIHEDHLNALVATSKKRNRGNMDLSLLTDGLQDERDQGITIDVAYRYFSISNKRYVIVDTPGHEQYTRNMFTGASVCDMAIILVDASRGVSKQTKRHAFICSLFNIPIIFAVNKMDLVQYKKSKFDKISKDLKKLSVKLKLKKFNTIPISALVGDNVVKKSKGMPWYKGKTLLQIIDRIETREKSKKFRMNVQMVSWFPQRKNSYKKNGLRLYLGQIDSGNLKQGETINVYPSMVSAKVIGIHGLEGIQKNANVGDAVSLELDKDVEVSRGYLFADKKDKVLMGDTLKADICWFSERPSNVVNKVIIRHLLKNNKAKIEKIEYIVDVDTLKHDSKKKYFEKNDIGLVQIRSANEVYYDPYSQNVATGNFVLIDEDTNETLAAGMVRK